MPEIRDPVTEIHLENISFYYPETEQLVFNNLSIDLPSGITTLVGQNGTGKSTLLLLAAGILLPAEGTVLLRGIDTRNLREEQERQRHVSFVYQNMEFETEESIGDLLEYVYDNGFHENKNPDLIAELVEVCELKQVLNKKTQEVSKGELQRTIVAFSLLYGSRIIMMDEPIFALEDYQKQHIMKYLVEYARSREISLYYSVHELDISEKYSDSLLLFHKDGRIELGQTSELYNRTSIEEAYEVPYVMLKRKEAIYREACGTVLPPAGDPAPPRPATFMINLIYDCDITMGLPGPDVDDGLALIYLLGRPEIRLLGVTSTFGNSSIEAVHPCLLSVLRDLGRDDIPAHPGAPRDAVGSDRSRDARADSDAARFLAETVGSSPGSVSILATGSPTNLLGAFRLHPGFFHDVKQLVFMGGITEPLIINGREMAELNLASDPQAALYALYAGQPPPRESGSSGARRSLPPVPAQIRCDIAVISGNLCLQALMTRERFGVFIRESRATDAEAIAVYLEEKVLPWFSWIEQVYGLPGFHAWDATAALYLTDPQLFESRKMVLRSTREDLRRGVLRFEGRTDSPPAPDPQPETSAGHLIDIPSGIRDLPAYWRTLFEAWRKAGSILPA